MQHEEVGIRAGLHHQERHPLRHEVGDEGDSRESRSRFSIPAAGDPAAQDSERILTQAAGEMHKGL